MNSDSRTPERTVHANFDALVALLDSRTRSGQWGTGWQLCCIQQGQTVIDAAGGIDGRERPVEPTSRFSIYCAGKPLTALAVAAAVEDKQLSFDDHIGDLISGHLRPALAALTVRDLLTHRGGLGGFPSAMFVAQTAAGREGLVRSIQPQPYTQTGTAYSEFAGWELLRLCLQHTTGQDIESYITHRVLAPLGLADAIGFRPDPSTHKLNVIVADDGPRPLLLEAGTINTTQVRVATGAVSSAQALASLYDALLRLEPRHLGISGATLDRLLNERTERHFDPVLDRDCQFGLGFMVNLADHLCGPLGESSFGHTGLAGMTFAGADPDLGLAFACHINGMLDHQPATERRLQVTAELVEGITSVRASPRW